MRILVPRLLGGVLTLVGVSMATFALFFVLPADPAALQCGRQCTADQVGHVRRSLGLDQSVPEQYADFMSGIFVGRTIGERECPAPCLGYSFRTSEPVTEIIGRAVPVTASVVAGAAVLWLVTGVSLGILAALRRGTWIDRFAVGLTLAGASMQTFFVGLMLQVILVYGLGWLPLPSYSNPLDDPVRWFGGMLLPWITLATVLAAGYTRLTRSALIDTMSEDFVRTARANGLAKPAVVRQAMRVAITPVVTMAGLDVGALLGGAVITETVFALPGLGMVSVRATQELNLPVVMATMLLAAFVVVAANIVVDLLYAVIDPRGR